MSDGWSAEAASYRAYALSPAGSVIRQAYFQAEDDAQAVAWVRSWEPAMKSELWQGHRKVMSVAAPREMQVSPSRPAQT